jgi:putative two-component system response regulator
LSHHERWDGSGYPQGLVGEAIPLAGRIVGLADSFDAMIGKRQFQEAFDIIFQGRGRLFDPDVVDAFLAQFEAIQAVADRELDTPEEAQARMTRLGRSPPH